MRNIKFEDECVIERIVGVDSYDKPLTQVIYNGKCSYQEGGYSQSQNIMTRTPLAFLPMVSALCETNDSIEIKTKFGRIYRGIVARSREIELPMTRERLTRLELKQAR